MDDAEELVRLRARVAELEEVRAPGGGPARGLAAAVLLVLACLAAPVAVVSVWAGSLVSDTNRYVETVAPVADDPGVQAAITDQVTTAIMAQLDLDRLTTEALEALADRPALPPRVAGTLPALAVPLTQGVEAFTRAQAAELLASSEFEVVWAELNRVAHAQVVVLLRGEQGGAVSAQDDRITLNLAPVVAEVRARLLDRGFALAERIPPVDTTFVLVESEGIGQAQRAYAVLDALGVWLPLATVVALAAGVLLAHDRRRALLRAALGITAGMVALGVALTLTRILYVQTTPVDLLTADSAGQVFDTLVRFLRDGLRATAVLFLLVALAAFLAGPSSAATRVRALADGGTVSRAPQGALRAATVLAGGLVLVFWSRPTAQVVVVVALLVVLALVLLSVLGRPPRPAPAVPTGSSRPDEVDRASRS